MVAKRIMEDLAFFLIGSAIGGVAIWAIDKGLKNFGGKLVLNKGDLIQEKMNNGAERTLYYDGTELHEVLNYNAIDFDQVSNFRSMSENQLSGIPEGGPITC